MDFWLLRAAAVVAFKDSQPFRQRVFAYLQSNRWLVRTVVGLHRRLGRSRLSSLMILGYGLKAFVGVAVPAGRRVWAIAAYRNERRQFDWLAGVGGEAPGFVDVSGRALLRPSGWLALLKGALSWRDVRFFFRQVHRVNQRGDFLIAARVASTLGYYLRLKPLVATSTMEVAWVSSDSNPYAMALWAAARSAGRKVVYVTHGHLPEDPPLADFDLTLLDGPACADVYERSHGIRGQVVFRGSEGTYRPLDLEGLAKDAPTVGVFMSLITDWPTFAALLPRIRDALNAKEIVLRMHPNKAIRDPNAMDAIAGLEGITVSDGERVLLEDAARCDLVVAGSSSCHLTVLKHGVPTAYVNGLDLCPHDFYRFLEDRIVPGFDTPEALNRDTIRALYSDASWEERFARYDAAYPNRDCDGEVRHALKSLRSGT